MDRGTTIVAMDWIVADGTKLLITNSAPLLNAVSLFGAALVISFSAKGTQLECNRCAMYVGKCAICAPSINQATVLQNSTLHPTSRAQRLIKSSGYGLDLRRVSIQGSIDITRARSKISSEILSGSSNFLTVPSFHGWIFDGALQAADCKPNCGAFFFACTFLPGSGLLGRTSASISDKNAKTAVAIRAASAAELLVSSGNIEIFRLIAQKSSADCSSPALDISRPGAGVTCRG